MRRLLPLFLLAGACSGTDPSELAVVEPGLYVLSDFDGGPAPANLSIGDYPDRVEVFAIAYDSVWIESANTFRRHYETRSITISKTVPADTTLWESQSWNYGGPIYSREGGLVLDDGEPFLNIPVFKFEVVEGILISRFHLGEATCSAPGVCQTIRDVILGARYDRR